MTGSISESVIVGLVLIFLFLTTTEAFNFMNFMKHIKNIQNEDQNKENNDFIVYISHKYSSYEEFLKSEDFDNYFSYWNANTDQLEKLKSLLDNKNIKSFFKYKVIKY